jgi:hypothetical protein
MRTFLLICTAAVAVTMAATTKSDAMSINAGAGIKPVIDATDMTQKAAVYIVEGHRYCFYFDGWHGAGWYRCGYARRQGIGWGGEYGWQGWHYDAYERRHEKQPQPKQQGMEKQPLPKQGQGTEQPKQQMEKQPQPKQGQGTEQPKQQGTEKQPQPKQQGQDSERPRQQGTERRDEKQPQPKQGQGTEQPKQ